jgi:nitroreductase
MQAILERRSIRRYKTDPIPDDDLRQILEAARQAPSASNRQPWHFIVVGQAAQKQKVAQACDGQMWMADAAYIVVALGTPALTPNWYRVDVSIALENIVLAAASLGYGTCWIGAFSPDQVRAVCQVPADLEIVACTPLGVPNIHPPARGRKDWNSVFSTDIYGQPMALAVPQSGAEV